MAKIRLFIQGIEHGGSGRVARAAGPAAIAKYTLLFSVEKTPGTTS